ncbi:MAG: hypothetical protein KTR33_16235 [Gammaproteobacteria bacterium]|nr:hypothetical protein [Gammaproteobacteria bacterium]
MASVVQLTELKRLGELRVRRAENAVREQRELMVQQQARVDKRQHQVDLLNHQARRVREFLAEPETQSDPVRLNDAYAQRHWIIYDREKEEFYLQQAQQDLEKAENELTQKTVQLNRALARQEESVRLLVSAQRAHRERLDIADSPADESRVGAVANAFSGALSG